MLSSETAIKVPRPCGRVELLDFESDSAVMIVDFYGKLYVHCKHSNWELYMDDDGNWQKRKITMRPPITQSFPWAPGELTRILEEVNVK